MAKLQIKRSMLYYAAVIYFRFLVAHSQAYISLVCAKTSFSFEERYTTLDLWAAVLLIKLVSFAIESFADLIKIDQMFA